MNRAWVAYKKGSEVLHMSSIDGWEVHQVMGQVEGDPIRNAANELFAACKAAIAYDDAIVACANDPSKMSTYCTAEGQDLDTLYLDWIEKSKLAIAKATGLLS